MMYPHTLGLGTNLRVLGAIPESQLNSLATAFNTVYLDQNSDANTLGSAYDTLLIALGFTDDIRSIRIKDPNLTSTNPQLVTATSDSLNELKRFFNQNVTKELNDRLELNKHSIDKEFDFMLANNYTVGQILDALRKMIIDSKFEKSPMEKSKKGWMIIGGALALGGIAFYIMNRSSK